jgi:predicted transcriptional regulator
LVNIPETSGLVDLILTRSVSEGSQYEFDHESDECHESENLSFFIRMIRPIRGVFLFCILDH